MEPRRVNQHVLWIKYGSPSLSLISISSCLSLLSTSTNLPPWSSSIRFFLCPGAQQQQPAVPEVREPDGCRSIRLQGHRAPDRSGGDGGDAHRQRSVTSHSLCRNTHTEQICAQQTPFRIWRRNIRTSFLFLCFCFRVPLVSLYPSDSWSHRADNRTKIMLTWLCSSQQLI